MPSGTPIAVTALRSMCSMPPAGWSPLDARHVDRVNAEGFLKSGKEMAQIAEDVARLAGLPDGGRRLLARTRALADRCVLDAARAISASARCISRSSRSLVRAGARPRRSSCGNAAWPGWGAGDARGPRVLHRLEDELQTYPGARISVVFPDRRRRRRPHSVDGGSMRRARVRGRQPRHLPDRCLRRRPVALRPADGALPVTATPSTCRISTSTWSPPGAPRCTKGCWSATPVSVARVWR